ncbi:MAG TPA: DUF6787 family protein [Flavobacteriaceae bacterium]|nr:DUF6787 family protein [Flavobacteriaceae bacterium]
MNKLKERWGLKSNLQVILVFVVFSINGSFAAKIAGPLTHFIGLDHDSTNPWLFWPVRILLVFVVYQITLPLVGYCFGLYDFFWNFSKKTLSRVGFKRFFEEKENLKA